MRRKLLISMATIIAAAGAFGAETVDINVGAKLIRPLTMNKSSNNLVGQALTTTAGDYSMTPVNVSFKGAGSSSVVFSADQYVDLSNGTDTIRMNTELKGGSVTSDGSEITSELVLSSAGSGTVEMDGSLTLAGTESAGTYAGTLHISVDYN